MEWSGNSLQKIIKLDLLVTKLRTFGGTTISNKQQNILQNWFTNIGARILYPTMLFLYLNIKLVKSDTVPAQTQSKTQNRLKKGPKMSTTLPAENPHVLQIREEDGHTNIWGQTEALWGRKSDLQDFVFFAPCAVCSLRFSKGRCRNETAFCFWWYFPFSLQPKIVTASKFERHLDEEVYLENLNFFDAVSFSYYAVH